MFSLNQDYAIGFVPYHFPQLTRKEFAELFDISIATLKRREAQGILHPTAINARVLYYTAENFAALLRLGYRPNVKAALRLGVDLAALHVPGFNQASPQVTSIPPTAPTVSAPTNPAQQAISHEAHILLANVRWLFSQPEIRQEIRRMLREVDQPDLARGM